MGYRGQCYCVNNGDVTGGLLFSGVYVERGLYSMGVPTVGRGGCVLQFSCQLF